MNMEKYNDLISQGISLMSSENYDAAKENFQKAIDQNPEELEAYIHMGNACANLGVYDEALASFKKALIVDSTNGEIHYAIGNVYLLMNENVKAIESYNKAENLGYKSSEMYQIMTMIFFEVGDNLQAMRNINRAINASPFDGELRLFKARIYLYQNRFEEALETLDDLKKILPDAFEAYDLRVQILLGLNKINEALEIVEEGIERFPEDADLTALKLKILVISEKMDEAEELIQEMKINGMYKNACKECGIQETIILLKKGAPEEAEKVLCNVADELKDDADIYYILIDLYAKTGKYKEVLEIANKMIALKLEDNFDAIARYFHAYALRKLERHNEADVEFKELTKFFRRMTISNPSLYEVYMYRLLSHAEIEEYDKALELADYLENAFPERADGHAFRYYIYQKQGKEEEAEIEKNKAKEINPKLNM